MQAAIKWCTHLFHTVINIQSMCSSSASKHGIKQQQKHSKQTNRDGYEQHPMCASKWERKGKKGMRQCCLWDGTFKSTNKYVILMVLWHFHRTLEIKYSLTYQKRFARVYYSVHTIWNALKNIWGQVNSAFTHSYKQTNKHTSAYVCLFTNIRNNKCAFLTCLWCFRLLWFCQFNCYKQLFHPLIEQWRREWKEEIGFKWKNKKKMYIHIKLTFQHCRWCRNENQIQAAKILWENGESTGWKFQVEIGVRLSWNTCSSWKIDKITERHTWDILVRSSGPKVQP